MNRDEMVQAAREFTWEQLNPDWPEYGDLTDRFSKSQFDNCPGCGQIEHISVYVATEDSDVAVSCRKCLWQVVGDCPSNAIENWGNRAQQYDLTAAYQSGYDAGHAAGVKEAGEKLAVAVPTDKEAWLEFGYLKADNNDHDMLWYNEGNADEFAYWWRALMTKARTNEPAGRIYFLFRMGELRTELVLDGKPMEVKAQEALKAMEVR